MLYGSCENIYYSDCGFYYYYDNEESISNSYSFKSQFYLYRNLVTLYKKVRDEYKIHDEANRILLRSLDNLADLFRCSEGEKSEYKKAADMLKGCRIDLKTLYNMDIQTKSKVKYTLFSLFGAYAHGCILSKLHKKLC
jgi:hypothetical protein